MNRAWRVRAATAGDAGAWSHLRHALWPEASLQAHAAEIDGLLSAPSPEALALLAVDEAGQVQGFAEASLRHDYVNGTDSSPVAFLEGWYIAPQVRNRGAGRALIVAVEAWARALGCRELASDSLLDNTGAHRAHQACGFRETERVVYFCKPLDGG